MSRPSVQVNLGKPICNMARKDQEIITDANLCTVMLICSCQESLLLSMEQTFIQSCESNPFF